MITKISPRAPCFGSFTLINTFCLDLRRLLNYFYLLSWAYFKTRFTSDNILKLRFELQYSYPTSNESMDRLVDIDQILRFDNSHFSTKRQICVAANTMSHRHFETEIIQIIFLTFLIEINTYNLSTYLNVNIFFTGNIINWNFITTI